MPPDAAKPRASATSCLEPTAWSRPSIARLSPSRCARSSLACARGSPRAAPLSPKWRWSRILEASRRLARVALPPDADRRDANAVLESLSGLFDGIAVAAAGGPILARAGERRLWIRVGDREFPLTAGTFFQGNRHLLGSLSAAVAREAASAPAGRALDLFGGVGFFAGALLDGGREVVTVEADHAAVEQALAARKRWRAGPWTVRHSDALAFLGRDRDPFAVIVADPPRAGLPAALTRSLSRRVGGLLVYVSCEPATLARDLAALLAGGLHIRSASLYDLFPLTHRVEAVVALSPPGLA